MFMRVVNLLTFKWVFSRVRREKGTQGSAPPTTPEMGSALPIPSKLNQGKESEAIGTHPKLSEPIRTLKCFWQLSQFSLRKILTYENLRQPTTTYYSLKIFLAPDLCLTRSRPNPIN